MALPDCFQAGTYGILKETTVLMPGDPAGFLTPLHCVALGELLNLSELPCLVSFLCSTNVYELPAICQEGW